MAGWFAFDSFFPQYKILFRSCTSLLTRLEYNDLYLFYLVKNGYSIALQQIASKGWDLSGGGDMDSCAMIQVFCTSYPDAWQLTDEESKPIVLEVLKALIPSATEKTDSFDQITLNQWTAINRTLDGVTKTKIFQEQFYSSLSSVIYAVCRVGFFSHKTAADLAAELSTNHGLHISLSQSRVSGYWNTLGKTYNPEDIKKLLDWLLPQVKGGTRLDNLVKFSKQKGLTVYYQVCTALESFPDFNWAFVYANARIDFENFEAARELVKDQPYFGYNDDIGIAAACNYPTLGYVSIKLNEIVGGQRTLNNFNSRVTQMVYRERWDKFIREYRNKVVVGGMTEEARPRAGYDQIYRRIIPAEDCRVSDDDQPDQGGEPCMDGDTGASGQQLPENLTVLQMHHMAEENHLH